MAFLKDSKYPLDLSRAGDSFKASLLPYLSKDHFLAFDVETAPDGIHVYVGDSTLNMTLDSIPLLAELFIPNAFYQLAVSSDYADNIGSVVESFSSPDEYAKFFTVTGALLGLQNALASNHLYDNRVLAGKCPEIAELLSALLRFAEQVDGVYSKLFDLAETISSGYVPGERFFPAFNVAISYFEDMTNIAAQTSTNFVIKNRIAISLLVAYHALYLSLVGSTITIANLAGQDFRKLLSIKDPDRVGGILGTMAAAQGKILLNNPDASLNDSKKKYFALLVNFSLFHKFVTSHTGYEFQDAFAEAFTLWGETINETLGRSDYDDAYIDQSLLNVGKDEVNSFNQLVTLHHPILEWNAMSHIHLQEDTVTPYALVAAFTLSLYKNDGVAKFYTNPLVKAVPDEKLDNDDEQLKQIFKIAMAEMYSGAEMIDTYRLYRLTLLATLLMTKYEKNEIANNLGRFLDNYITALYLTWFKTGKMMAPVRDMNRFTGIESYHILHKEVLMIIGTYQSYLYNEVTNKKNDSEQVYYYGTMMEQLFYSWLYKVKAERSYFEDFSSLMKNLVLATGTTEDMARGIYNGESFAATVEIIGAYTDNVGIRAIVEDYDLNVPIADKQKDLDAILNLKIEDDYLLEMKNTITGSELEARALLLGGSNLEAIHPLDFVTFFVVVAIEKILAIWSDLQSVAIDATMVLPVGEAKHLIARTNFMEGGTLKTIEREVEELNPLMVR